MQHAEGPHTEGEKKDKAAGDWEAHTNTTDTRKGKSEATLQGVTRTSAMDQNQKKITSKSGRLEPQKAGLQQVAQFK